MVVTLYSDCLCFWHNACVWMSFCLNKACVYGVLHCLRTSWIVVLDDFGSSFERTVNFGILIDGETKTFYFTTINKISIAKFHAHFIYSIKIIFHVPSILLLYI